MRASVDFPLPDSPTTAERLAAAQVQVDAVDGGDVFFASAGPVRKLRRRSR